jgi:hypothetical protein
MRFTKMPGVASSGIGSPSGLIYLPSVDKFYALTYYAYYRGTPGLYACVPELAEITDLQTWDRNTIQLFWNDLGEPNACKLDGDWCAGRKLAVYGNKIYFATEALYLTPMSYQAKIWSYDGTTLTNEYTVNLADADGYTSAYPADICVYGGVLYITLTESIVTYNGSTWSEITPGGITSEQRTSGWSNDYAGMGVHDNKLYVSMANYDLNTGDQYYKFMVTADGTNWDTALSYSAGDFGVEWGDNVFQSLISFNGSIYMLTDADYVYASKLYRWSGITDENPILVAEDVGGETWRYFGPMTICTQAPDKLLIGSFDCVKSMDVNENIVEVTRIVPENTHGIDLTFEATYAEKNGVLYWVATCDAQVGGSGIDPVDYYASEGYQLAAGTRLYFSNIEETDYNPLGGLDPIGWWSATNIEEAVQNKLTLGAQNEGFASMTRSWPYVSHGYVLLGQFVSPPLTAGQTLSGTVLAQIRAMESDVAADMSLRIEIERYDKDGHVYWDDQYTDNKLFNVEPLSLTNEFATTLTNQQVVEGSLAAINWVDYNGNPQPTTLDGDRLLVLIGYISFKDDPTGYPGSMEVGTLGANDLPEDNVSTNQYNPWIEFSQILEFLNEDIDLPIVTTVNVTDIDCMSAIGHGVINSDGGGTISEKGFVWSKSPNPTIDDEKVIVP